MRVWWLPKKPVNKGALVKVQSQLLLVDGFSSSRLALKDRGFYDINCAFICYDDFLSVYIFHTYSFYSTKVVINFQLFSVLSKQSANFGCILLFLTTLPLLSRWRLIYTQGQGIPTFYHSLKMKRPRPVILILQNHKFIKQPVFWMDNNLERIYKILIYLYKNVRILLYINCSAKSSILLSFYFPSTLPLPCFY